MTRHEIKAAATWLLGAAALLASAAAGAGAGADDADPLRQAPLPSLQRAYLACVAQSELRALTIDEAAGCSVIYETLKQRMFDGSFERMLAWTREQKLEQASPRSALR